MSYFKVVVSDDRHGDYSIEKKILSECGAELTILNCKNTKEMIENCYGVDGILLDMAPAGKEVIESLKKCKIISRYGVGYDNVDVSACTRQGIYVSNVPDYCAEDVSDMALALLLTCQRKICIRDKEIRAGNWNMNYPHTYRIKGKILSILGFGKIAKKLVEKVKGLGLKEIIVYDPYIDEEEIKSHGAIKKSFKQVLIEGDYISLHMPVNEDTKEIIDEEAFLIMKPSAIIINTARGQLIKEEAIINALKEKRISYAGLDTHTVEPLPTSSELLKLKNCVITDHAGYRTEESIIELKTKAAENVKAVLEGGKPLYSINDINKLDDKGGS